MAVEREKMDKAARILSRNVLTPVIYICEKSDRVTFVCFCDRNVTMGEIAEAEKLVKEVIDRPVRIEDIREFDESERLEIVKSATMVHAHSPEVRQMFEISLMADFQNAMERRTEILERSKKCGAVFLQ